MPPPSGGPSSTARLSYLLSLPKDADFLRESADASRAAAGWQSLHPDEWETFWPRYCEVTLLPFVRKWKALPLWEMELTEPDPRRRIALAIQSGRWGVIPVFPRTTAHDITRQARVIRRAIGKQHRDAAGTRRAAVASWLQMHGVARRDIARDVWNRRSGLRRPTTSEAIARLSEEEERTLTARFGRAHRRVYRAARGSEARAVSMIRKAVTRHDEATARFTEDLLSPKARDPLGSLLTAIFQADLNDDPEKTSLLLRDLRLALIRPRI
jgi:hypothetical protein